MKEKTRFTCILILNIILFALAIIGGVMSVGKHNLVGSFVYYTQDSNLFLGITSAIYLIATIRALATKEYRIPFWVQLLKYLSVCCIAVTFFVVLFILAPMSASAGMGGLGYMLFQSSMLFQHFLSPVIGLAGFILLEKQPQLKFKYVFSAWIPTLVYAAVLYPLNIASIVDGPYPFLQVHKIGPVMSVVWFFILLLLSFVLAWLVWLLHKKIRT